MKNQKAQMKLSFGMIFSIILIIIFIAFAVYGISKFLDISNKAQIGNFKEKLQNHVTNAWEEAEVSQDYSYSLPKEIIQVCFEDKDSYNMKLISKKGPGLTYNIEHLKIKEKFYVDNINGKIKIRLEKNYEEPFVRIMPA